MSNNRHAIHAELVARLEAATAAAGDVVVRSNADTPNDWDAAAMVDIRRVLVVRHGGFTRRRITGKTDWFHEPSIEGHTRAASDAELGEPSNALLDAVVAVIDADPTLGGLCERLDCDMPNEPEPNVAELAAGSMLTWRLNLTAHVEERTES